MRPVLPLVLLLCIGFAGCGGQNTSSNVRSPGGTETAKTATLETGTALLQNKEPISELNVYMDGFHFYNGNMQGQMEAHHYCSVLNEDLNQCVIFDGNGKDAKIMASNTSSARNSTKRCPLTKRNSGTATCTK